MKLVITPTVYVAVGITASGKSHWWTYAAANKEIPIKQCKRINTDLIRSDLHGDINDHSKDDIIEKICFTNLKSFLLHQVPLIYIDDNNLERNRRMKITDLCKKANYRSVALVFETPFEICQKRIKDSKKNLALETLQRQFKILKETPVDYDEGWDDILVIKS